MAWSASSATRSRAGSTPSRVTKVGLALAGVLAAGGLAEQILVALDVQQVVDDLVGQAQVLGEGHQGVALGLARRGP